MRLSKLKKVASCRKNRENAVLLQNGSAEFELYREMSDVITAYKFDPEMTISDALETLEAWLRDEFVTTSKWQKIESGEKAMAKVRRYLLSNPEKSLETEWISFLFSGEIYTGFRPDFVILKEIETPEFLNKQGLPEKIPMLQVIKFSAGKQKVGCGTRGRAIEATVNTHPFTLGAVFYAKQFFAKCNTHFFGIQVCFDSLVSEVDNKDYKEDGYYGRYEANSSEKAARTYTCFLFKKDAIVRHYTSQSAYSAQIPPQKFFSKMKELIDGINKSESCSKADCEKCILYNRCHYTEPPIALPEKSERAFNPEDIHLSPEQEAIVGARNGIFRVLATAGAGKTFCMVLRVIRLIETGVDPKDMLLVSFSNIAVEELRDRIGKMLKVFGYDEDIDVNEFTIATFNSLGNTLIQEYYELLGFSKKPALIDNIEQYDMISELVQESEERIPGLDYENPFLKFGSNTVGVVPKLGSFFDEIKRNHIETFADYDKYLGLTEKIHKSAAGAETVAAQEERSAMRMVFEEFEKYAKKLKDADIIDYADQSILVEELIKKSFEDGIDYILEVFHFEHIIVDEFQDSNEFQLQFVKALMENMSFKSLMVVGDDSQAIYGFNGTSPENIIHFDKKLGMKVVDLTLSETRRFGQDVCDIANAILAPNVEKVEKHIHSSQPTSEFVPRLIGFDSKTTEYDTIALEMRQLIDKGVHPEDIIFLSTKNDDLDAIMKSLNKVGVPALKLSEKFTGNSRVIAMIALAKFVLDFDNTVALMDYLNEAYGNTFFDCAPEEVEAIIEREKIQFVNLFLTMDDDERFTYIMQLIDKVDISCDLTAQAFVKKVKNRAETCVNAYDLAAYIVKYEKYDSSDEAKLTGKYPAVTLSTVWKAKGGEWDYVFCSLSSIDSAKRLDDNEIEERRRLIFTMVTRMKKGLTVTSVKNLSRKTKTLEEEGIPNRFYDEMKKIPGFDKSEIEDIKKKPVKKSSKAEVA